MKRLTLIFSLLIVFTICTQAQISLDFTTQKAGAFQIFDSTVLTSADTDTVDIYIKTVKGQRWNYGLVFNAIQNSGTSEVWVDTWVANHYYQKGFSLITRAAGDTLNASFGLYLEKEKDNFSFKFLRVIVTAKTASQNTTINGWINITMD